MQNNIYINISFLGLLLVSKLTSSFINMSPFIATIIIGAYFIKNKYHLLIIIFISQIISDISFGMYLSNILVYISYYLIVKLLYYLKKDFSLINSFLSAIYLNFIFFCVSNFGHFIAYSDTYTIASLSNSYLMGIPFGRNLLFSTILFVLIFHTLLAVSKKQLVKN